MPTDEEFAVLKKQVELLQTNFNVIAASHKNLLEVRIPSDGDQRSEVMAITIPN
jgi:hypothetical protein